MVDVKTHSTLYNIFKQLQPTEKSKAKYVKASAYFITYTIYIYTSEQQQLYKLCAKAFTNNF